MFCPFTKLTCNNQCAMNAAESCAFILIAESLQNISAELESIDKSLDSLSSSGIEVHTDD